MLGRAVCYVMLLTSLAQVQGQVIAKPKTYGSPRQVISDQGSPFGQLETSSWPVRRSIDLSNGIDLPEHKVEDVTRTRPRRSDDTSKTGGIDWNRAVDSIFVLARKDILKQGKDVIPLAEVRKNFKRKLGFFTVSGRFFANQGTVRNMTSFRRSGDVSAVRETGENYKMVCVLTLDELKVRYDHYELDVGGLGPRGFLEGSVDKNTVLMTFNFEVVDGGCVSTLKEVKLAELGGLRVTLSGLGDLDSLGSAVATWIVEQRKEEIAADVERVLSKEIEELLKDFQCDEYASLVF